MEYSEKAREKSYAITYWSNWGMGSDTEVGLITSSDSPGISSSAKGISGSIR